MFLPKLARHVKHGPAKTVRKLAPLFPRLHVSYAVDTQAQEMAPIESTPGVTKLDQIRNGTGLPASAALSS